MSWIVQNLWSNRTRIKEKSNVSPREYINHNYFRNYDLSSLSETEGEEHFFIEEGYDDPFIESDEFNDLLVIEKAVTELKELGLLSQHDLEVLHNSGEGNFNNNNRQRKTDSKHFYSVCERIAYYLGGYFTDEGYLNYITRRYKLTPQQQEIAREYMRSKFKNKILSKGYRIEDNHEETRLVPA